MRLTYLWIQRFGKLREKEIFLEDGINVIYGPNESGKSTLHSFIRGMLFGVARYRGRASRTDPYTRYEPWERPADYAGSMRFEAGGKLFRIDRNFYKSDIRESLVCETDGEELSIRQGDLEMLLGGISESVYDNTVSVGQLRSETDEGMVRELQNYMTNYEGSGSGEIDVQLAADRLRRKKKQWETRRQELEERKSRQRENLENKIAYVRQEKEGLERQLAGVRKEKEGLERQLSGVRKEKEETERQLLGVRQEEGAEDQPSCPGKERKNRKLKKVIWLSGIAVGILLILAGILLGRFGHTAYSRAGIYISIFGGVLMLEGIVTGVKWVLSMEKKKGKSPDAGGNDTESGEESGGESAADFPYEKIYKKLSSEISRICGREEELNQQLSEKVTTIQNLLENREDISGATEEIQICDTEIKSLELALETLMQLSGNMRRRIGSRLQSRMESILSEITGGKYSRIMIDEDMKIMLCEWNRKVSLYQLSRGTVEQVYFALRMAVSEILCEENMPVLLDDVFAMYDEERLVQTLRWLDKKGGQVLIFTCHRREAQLLSQMGIEINLIEMG